MYLRVLLAIGVVGISVLAGLWLGDNWDSLRSLWESPTATPARTTAAPPEPEGDEEARAAFTAPLYFQAGLPGGADASAARGEIALAAGAGIHRHMVTAPLPWPGQSQDAMPVLERLDMLVAADPDARMVVCVSLNPPAVWLEGHASATVTVDGAAQPFPCVASEAWLADAQAGLTALIQALAPKHGKRILGYQLNALENGRWCRSNGLDGCQDNLIGFRRWLRLQYANDDLLRKAWGDEAITLDAAAIPPAPEAVAGEVFLELPAMQGYSDFLRYTSESVAEAVAALAAHVKEQAGPEAQVYVPYGHSFDVEGNDAGHLALSKLLDAPVDVFVSPVSYADRGLGGTGGYMGPVDSALQHGKQWLLIDDTRIVVAADPANPGAGPLAPPTEDILNVQRRNFAAALCRGIGLCWSDAEGTGGLNDPETWNRIGRMRESYEGLYAATADGAEAPMQPLYDRVTLAVVVDEASRFCERDGRLYGALLRQCQSTALRAGTPVQFCLLQDVLRDTAPVSSVYWFVNAFRLTAEQRTRLHEVLAREKAAAIWQYAPGYFTAEGPSAQNIAATVRMSVSAFKNGGRSGSKYALLGKWIAKDDTFGSDRHWNPLLWIDDEGANVLARYADSNKPSVALVYPEEGWRSVFVAEPEMTPALLRELLTLLEEHIFFRKMPPVSFDACYFAPEVIAVHAGEAGDRAIDFGQVFDVQDVFSPETGWPRTRLINLGMYPGETRVMRLSPSRVGE